MPKYTYLCGECEMEFEVKHSIKERCEKCKNCGSEKSIERIPSGFFLSKKDTKNEHSSTPGHIVKEAIEEAREDLKQDKEALKKRVYNK
jgi:putative FmdB family regulatory protein|tara:strand:+ start:35 stop:301 length:267 start_codon:yes stop_codon:yes gene_type:complete